MILKVLVPIVIGALIVVSGGTYVAMTRSDDDPQKYQRSDVLSLDFMTVNVPTDLSIKLRLIVPDTANIPSVCHYSSRLRNTVYKNVSKKSAELKRAKGANFETIKPELLQIVRNSLRPNPVVDLDYSFKTGSVLVAVPKYHAVRVGCPD
ncbi:MAG: hypothetical protein HOG95_01430 [Rhodospirillaceae bacterium]|jgi:hypothetical protein|nr:hypothetical protein [Rhodospirillaceae bacterium]MBT5938556.1 hypothetical protein [Rhodospirillaceae bacterium]MBT7266005.1 hypothetical protein [Rhodospirillaceae bacterium]